MKYTFILLIITATVVCIYRFYGNKQEIRLPFVGLKAFETSEKSFKSVRCDFVSKMGANRMHIKMLIPCEDKKQQADLRKKLSRLKSDFIFKLDTKEMDEYIRVGNFNEIKTRIVRIVNQHAEKPVDTIYFDSLLY